MPRAGHADHRTTIVIDLDAYEHAQKALGTHGFRETVNAALRDVGRRQALDRAADLILSGDLPIVVTPHELEQLRKPRYEA